MSMSYFKRFEEDDWLRLQRRNESQEAQSTIQQSQLTAFQSMTGAELEWVSAWYVQFVQHQQMHLWKQFEALSTGQKRALLLDVTHANDGPTHDLHQKPDWPEWSAKLEWIAELPLQDEETFHEKRIEDGSTIAPFYMMKQSEILSPFREILLWLCYKGNHQGQQALLQRIDQLNIEAKKLLILRLLGKQKCNCLNFSQEITILQHQKMVVDWERINNQLQSLQQLDNDRINKELVKLEQRSTSAMGPPNVLPHSMMYDDELMNESSSSIFSDEMEQDQGDLHAQDDLQGQDDLKGHDVPQAQEEEWMMAELSSSELSLSLLNQLQTANDLHNLLLSKAIQAKSSQSLKRNDLIDLCLKIPLSWSLKKRDKARSNKIHSLNFSSPQQFFAYLIEHIVQKLYQHGVLEREPKYVELLRALSLVNGQAMPSKQYMMQKLQARFEQ